MSKHDELFCFISTLTLHDSTKNFRFLTFSTLAMFTLYPTTINLSHNAITFRPRSIFCYYDNICTQNARFAQLKLSQRHLSLLCNSQQEFFRFIEKRRQSYYVSKKSLLPYQILFYFCFPFAFSSQFKYTL